MPYFSGVVANSFDVCQTFFFASVTQHRLISEVRVNIQFTYLLAQCYTVLLKKLTGFQLIKKFPPFYGTQMFITAFTNASVWTFPNKIRFYDEELLAHRPTSELEDHPLLSVRDCLFNTFAATLHTGGCSSIRNLWKRHAVVTWTPLSWICTTSL